MTFSDESPYAEDACSRRDLLKYLAATGMMMALPTVLANISGTSSRHLSLYNLHTEERLNVIYWQKGQYLKEALNAINHLLRDHRSGESSSMDKALLDLMFLLQKTLHSQQPFQIISGYRSPATNEMLRQNSSGVAKQSLHTLGKAVDLRLPGTPLSILRETAISLQAGGVGYYPQSNFIHIDTGRVRKW